MIRRSSQPSITTNEGTPTPTPGGSYTPGIVERPSLDPSAAFYRIRTAISTYGVSRSFIYRALADGKVVAVKAGRSVLIDGNSLRAYLASLPKAVFKAP